MNMVKVEEVEKLVAGVSSLIPTVGAIVSGVMLLINALDTVTQEDKDALIARIKKAQESVPVWE
jgi:hypothetical protein